MTFQENVPLAPFTTFRIGGAARFFVQAQSVEDIEKAVAFAKDEKDEEKASADFVLGGGSNVLISDNGFNGLVIKNELKGIAEEEVVNAETGQSCTRIIAAAGESWDNLVKYAVEEKGLYGFGKPFGYSGYGWRFASTKYWCVRCGSERCDRMGRSLQSINKKY